MKKITSILLIISSLFTLSSLSFSYCGAEEVTKAAEVESITSNVNEITKEDQEIRNEKIKKFLDEKGKYFPECTLMEINSILHSLTDAELEIALNLDFKKPLYITLATILGGFVGLDSFILGDGAGHSRLILGAFNLLSAWECHGYLGREITRRKAKADLKKEYILKHEHQDYLYQQYNFICIDHKVDELYPETFLSTVLANTAILCVPGAILDWVTNIFTASSRAKAFNYQLLLKTMVKNKTNLQIIKK